MTKLWEKYYLMQGIGYKRSHRRCSVQRDVLNNLAIFTGKHLCWSLILWNTDTFHFEPFTLPDIQNELKSLNLNKATTHNNIPQNTPSKRGSYCYTLPLLFSNTLSNSEFAENLKLADVTPVFMKKDSIEKA